MEGWRGMESLQIIASIDEDLNRIAANYRAVQTIDEQATIIYCQKLTELAQSVSKKTHNQYELYLLILCKIMDQLRQIYVTLAPTIARLKMCQELFILCTKAILGIQWKQLPEDNPGKAGMRIVLGATHSMLSAAGYNRIQLLLNLMDTHWGDPVLSKIMSNDCDDEEEAKAYVRNEDPMVLKLRVELLLDEDCEEFVINLCHWCTFHPMLKDDIYLRQTQLLLLHRHNCVSKFREECQMISCHFGVQIVKSLEQLEQHGGVCVLLAQTFLIQDWINPNSYCCTQDLLKLWIRHQYLADKDVEKFSDSVWSIAKLSRNTMQLGMLIDALRKECGLDKFLQLYTDLAIYALNLDKGIWDCARSLGDDGAIAMSEKALARTCVQIHNIYEGLNLQVQLRSIITAFALNPSEEHFAELVKVYGKKILSMQKHKGEPSVTTSALKSDALSVESLKNALPTCGEQTVSENKQSLTSEISPLPVASTSKSSEVVITDSTKMQMQVDMGSARILEKGTTEGGSINPATLYEMDRLFSFFRPWFLDPLLPWTDLCIVAKDYIANDKSLSPDIEVKMKDTLKTLKDEQDKGCDTVQIGQGDVVSRDQFLAQVKELEKTAFKKRGRGRPPIKKAPIPETDNKEVQKSNNSLEKMYKTVYKCLICSTLYEDVHQLKEHVRSICRPEGSDCQKDNDSETISKQPSSCPLLKCRLCNTVKPTMQEFELHLATSHAAECDGTGGNIKICHLYRCKYCKVFFSRREDLQNHLNVCRVKMQRIANGEIQPKTSGDSPTSVTSSVSPVNEDVHKMSQDKSSTDLAGSGVDSGMASDGTPVVKKKRGRKKKESTGDVSGQNDKKGVQFHSTSDSEGKQAKKRGRKKKELHRDDESNSDNSTSQNDRGEGRKLFPRKVKDVAKEKSATRELIEKLLKSKDDGLEMPGKEKTKIKQRKMCEICTIKVRNHRTLLQHYAMSHLRPYKFFTNKGKNAFMCFYCKKFFETFLKYVNHIHLHEQIISSAIKTFKNANPGLSAPSGHKPQQDSDSDSSEDSDMTSQLNDASTDSSTETDVIKTEGSNLCMEETSMESSSVSTPTKDLEKTDLPSRDDTDILEKSPFASAESSSTEMDFETESNQLIESSNVDSTADRSETQDSQNTDISVPYVDKLTEESNISSCEKTCSEYEPSTCPSSASDISTAYDSTAEDSMSEDLVRMESVEEEFMQFRTAPTILQEQSGDAEQIVTKVSVMEMTPLPSDWNASLNLFVGMVSGGNAESVAKTVNNASATSSSLGEHTASNQMSVPQLNDKLEQVDSSLQNQILPAVVDKPSDNEQSKSDISTKQRSFADEFASIISMSKCAEITEQDRAVSDDMQVDHEVVISTPDCGHPANLILKNDECPTLCPHCGQIVPADPSTFTPESPPKVLPEDLAQTPKSPDWSKITKQLSVTISAKDRALCSLASKKLSFDAEGKSRKARSNSLDSDNKHRSSASHQKFRRSSTHVQSSSGRTEALSPFPVQTDVAKKPTRRVSRIPSIDLSASDQTAAVQKASKTSLKEKPNQAQKTEVIIDTVDISGICAFFATCESEPRHFCAKPRAEASNLFMEQNTPEEFTSDSKTVNTMTGHPSSSTTANGTRSALVDQTLANSPCYRDKDNTAVSNAVLKVTSEHEKGKLCSPHVSSHREKSDVSRVTAKLNDENQEMAGASHGLSHDSSKCLTSVSNIPSIKLNDGNPSEHSAANNALFPVEENCEKTPSQPKKQSMPSQLSDSDDSCCVHGSKQPDSVGHLAQDSSSARLKAHNTVELPSSDVIIQTALAEEFSKDNVETDKLVLKETSDTWSNMNSSTVPDCLSRKTLDRQAPVTSALYQCTVSQCSVISLAEAQGSILEAKEQQNKLSENSSITIETQIMSEQNQIIKKTGSPEKDVQLTLLPMTSDKTACTKEMRGDEQNLKATEQTSEASNDGNVLMTCLANNPLFASSEVKTSVDFCKVESNPEFVHKPDYEHIAQCTVPKAESHATNHVTQQQVWQERVLDNAEKQNVSMITSQLSDIEMNSMSVCPEASCVVSIQNTVNEDAPVIPIVELESNNRPTSGDEVVEPTLNTECGSTLHSASQEGHVGSFVNALDTDLISLENVMFTTNCPREVQEITVSAIPLESTQEGTRELTTLQDTAGEEDVTIPVSLQVVTNELELNTCSLEVVSLVNSQEMTALETGQEVITHVSSQEVVSSTGLQEEIPSGSSQEVITYTDAKEVMPSACLQEVIPCASCEEVISSEGSQEIFASESQHEAIPSSGFQEVMSSGSSQKITLSASAQQVFPPSSLHEVISFESSEEATPSVDSQKQILFHSFQEVGSTETLNEVIPSESSEEVTPSVDLREGIPPETSHEVIPSESSEEVTPSVDLREGIPPETLHEVMPSENSEEVTPSVDLREGIPPETSHEVIPSESSEEVTPSVDLQEGIPPKTLHELMPSENSEEVTPSVDSLGGIPPKTLHEVIPSESSEEVTPFVDLREGIPPETLHEVIPSENSEEVTPSVELQKGIPPETLHEVIQSSSSHEEMSGEIHQEVIQSSSPQEVISGEIHPEVIQPSSPQEVISGEIHQEVIQPSSSQEVISGEIHQEVIQSSSPQEVIEPSSSQGVMLGEIHQEVTKSSSPQEVMSCEIHQEVIQSPSSQDELSGEIHQEVIQSSSSQEVMSCEISQAVIQPSSSQAAVSCEISHAVIPPSSSQAAMSCEISQAVIQPSSSQAAMSCEISQAVIQPSSSQAAMSCEISQVVIQPSSSQAAMSCEISQAVIQPSSSQAAVSCEISQAVIQPSSSQAAVSCEISQEIVESDKSQEVMSCEISQEEGKSESSQEAIPKANPQEGIPSTNTHEVTSSASLEDVMSLANTEGLTSSASLQEVTLSVGSQPAESSDEIIPSTGLEEVIPPAGSDEVRASASSDEITSVSSGEILPQASSQGVIPSESSQTVIPSESSQEVIPSESLQEVIPSACSQTVIPSENSQKVIPSESSQTVMPSQNSQEVIPSENSQEVIPSASSQEVIPSESSQTVMPSENSQEVIPSSSTQEVIPSENSQEVIPSSSSQEVTPSESLQAVLISENSQELIPSESSEEVISSASSQEVIPSANSQEVIPSASSQEVIPSESSQEVIPLESSKEVILSESSQEVKSSESSQDMMTLVNSKKEINCTNPEEVIPSSSTLEVLPVSNVEVNPCVNSKEVIPSTSMHEVIPFASLQEQTPLADKDDEKTEVKISQTAKKDISFEKVEEQTVSHTTGDAKPLAEELKSENNENRKTTIKLMPDLKSSVVQSKPFQEISEPDTLSVGDTLKDKMDEQVNKVKGSDEEKNTGHVDEEHVSVESVPEVKVKKKPGRPRRNQTLKDKNVRMVTRQTSANQPVPISRPQRKRTRTCLGNDDYIYLFPFKQPKQRTKDSTPPAKKEEVVTPCAVESVKNVNHPVTRLRGAGSKGKSLTDTRKRDYQTISTSTSKLKPGCMDKRGKKGGDCQPSVPTRQDVKQSVNKRTKNSTADTDHSNTSRMCQKVLRSGKKTLEYPKIPHETGGTSTHKSSQKNVGVARVTRSSESTSGSSVTSNISTNPKECLHSLTEKADLTSTNDTANEPKGPSSTSSDVILKDETVDGNRVKLSDSSQRVQNENISDGQAGKCGPNPKPEKCGISETDEQKEIPSTSKILKDEQACTNEDSRTKNSCSGMDIHSPIEQHSKEKTQGETSSSSNKIKCDNVISAPSSNLLTKVRANFGSGLPSVVKELKPGSGNIYTVQRCAGTQTSGCVPKGRSSTSNSFSDKVKIRDSPAEIDPERKANFVRMGRTMSLKSRLLPKSSKPFTWDMDDNGDHISSSESREKKLCESQSEEPTLLTLRKSLRSRNFEPIHREKNFEVLRRGALHKAAREGLGRGHGTPASTSSETAATMAKSLDTTPFEVVNRMATRRAQNNQKLNSDGSQRQNTDTNILSSGVKTSVPSETINSSDPKTLPLRTSKRKVESGTNTDIRFPVKCSKLDKLNSGVKQFAPKVSLPVPRNTQWSARRNQRTNSVTPDIIVTYPGGTKSVISANSKTPQAEIRNHIAQQLAGPNSDQNTCGSKQQDRILSGLNKSGTEDCANSDSGSSNGDAPAGQKWKMQRRPGKQGFSFSFTKARLH